MTLSPILLTITAGVLKMKVIDNVRLMRQRARERRERSFILNRDDGCIYCKRFTANEDEPFRRYLWNDDEPRFIETDRITKKKYAICEWHREILWKWADAEKQKEMLKYMHDYLKDAQPPF